MKKLPDWFKQEIPQARVFSRMEELTRYSVSTVCREARCPNLNNCLSRGRVTFLILGNVCTRGCRFCCVKKNFLKLAFDPGEPLRVARAARDIGIKYAVITSVTRDDLSDGGAAVFAETVRRLRAEGIGSELLIPDFKGQAQALQLIIDSSPLVVAHNLETVKRLYAGLRPQADYARSLMVLRKIKQLSGNVITKSSLMLGFGEREAEVVEAMRDLRYNYCDIVTFGQYLAPTPGHYPVKEFINPAQFDRYRDIGESLGFKKVLSAPLARSSFLAEEVYQELSHV